VHPKDCQNFLKSFLITPDLGAKVGGGIKILYSGHMHSTPYFLKLSSHPCTDGIFIPIQSLLEICLEILSRMKIIGARHEP
jgi:hypothetical protein